MAIEKTKIVKGDIVNIFWEIVPAEWNVEVLYIPCDTGDTWKFRREDGTILAVGFFSKMEVVKPFEEEYKTCGHCGGDMTQRFLYALGSSVWKCHNCRYSSVTGD